MKLPRRTLLLITFLLINSWVYAGQTQAHMSIYTGVPGVDKILSGDYVEAIDEMKKTSTENPVLLYSNLCVAYILNKQTGLARESCQLALSATGRSKNFGQTWLERRYSRRIRNLYQKRVRHHLSILNASL